MLRKSASPRVEVAEALRGAIHDPDPRVRTIAYEALVAIGLAQPKALSVLFEAAKAPTTRDEARIMVKALGHSESLLDRRSEARRVSRRGSHPTLFRVLHESDPWLRGTVAEFLVSYLDTLESVCGSECEVDRAELISALASRWRSRDQAIRRPVLVRLLRSYPRKTLLSLFRTLMEIDAESSGSTRRNPREGGGTRVSLFLATLSPRDPAPDYKSFIKLLPDQALRQLLPEIRDWLSDGDGMSPSEAFSLIKWDLLVARQELFPPGGSTRHWMLEAMQEAVGRGAMADEAYWISQELEVFHRRGRKTTLTH
ncbi:HEAT repeat domain-containing protein [Aquisphaera insulae]|uniref:HEAT repeat domain-containing protein n=1 Tax=Aquisphaera insulae TaxID=2712864 RepID=UPI0020303B5E|nr:HEAT repeat domain-containing protein [Aquisphaera insulae]